MFLLKKKPLVLLALIFLALVAALAIFVPLLSSQCHFSGDLELRDLAPSKTFWFGTDSLGRDLFFRTFYGARISLSIGLIAALIDLGLGVVLGLTAAFFKGVTEEVLMRLCDILSSLPSLLIAILLLVFLGPGFFTIIFALIITGWINQARIVRSKAKELLKTDFILAAYSLGASNLRILAHHLLPNLFGTITATATLAIPSAIFAETFLSFLGLGLQAPMASWGVMLNDALPSFAYRPYQIFFPSLFLSLTLICLNLIGDGLKETFAINDKKV